MIYITVELNKDIYIKIPKVKEGISPYNLTMTSQAGGQQMVFTDLVDNSDKSSVYRFILNFTQYTPSGIYNYILIDTADKQISKGLVQVNMTDSEDYFYQDDTLGYFIEDEGCDMSNYYTKSQVDSMLTQYEKKSDLPDFSNFVTSEELQQEVTRQIDEKHIITEEDLNQSVASYIQTKIEEGDLVTRTEVNNVVEGKVTYQLSNIDFVTEQNMEEYVESYINSKDLVNSTQLTNTLEWYVTDAELQNMGYVTADNLRQNYYNKPETEANFTSYAYIEERISRIPGGGITMDDVKDYVVSQSYITSSVLNDQAYITATQLNSCGYATVSQIPVVSNAGIVIKQGGITKGSFSLNQSAGATIDLDEGGSVDLSSYLTKQELVEQSYITSSTLTDYATKTYVETKIAGIDLSSYITKQELVNQAYITNTYLDDYATKAYVQEKINEIPVADLSSYVSKSDLNNYGYQTSTQVQNTVNTSINSLNSYTLVFTLADDSTVTVIAYTK